MISENDVKNTIEHLKNDNKSFCEFIGEILKDRLVEVYMGDKYEEVSTEQITTPYPSVFCGKVVGGYKNCLILNCSYVKSKKIEVGNIIFLNEISIKAINEIDGHGILKDMLLDSQESISIMKAFGR